MGAIESYLKNFKEEKVTCCDKEIAFYRCQYTDEKLRSIHYHTHCDNVKLNSFEEPIKSIIIKLKPYWHASINNTIKWIACNKCKDKVVIKYFTYFPNGWKENIKYEHHYENLNF